MVAMRRKEANENPSISSSSVMTSQGPAPNSRSLPYLSFCQRFYFHLLFRDLAVGKCFLLPIEFPRVLPAIFVRERPS
jgi:hypothetical protein